MEGEFRGLINYEFLFLKKSEKKRLWKFKDMIARDFFCYLDKWTCYPPLILISQI